MTEALNDLLSAQPPIEKEDGKRQSDDEVMRFIAGELEQDPTVSKTRARRALRETGFVCEQSRFGSLFSRSCPI